MDRRGRTMTLWEQLTTPDLAIRDLLKVPHDDEGGDGDAGRRPCTLMDAIGRESRGESGMISWNPLRLRDRLRIRRAANDARSTTTSNRRADEDGTEEESKAPAAASMSLMALLEQADSQWDEDEDDANASQRGAAAGDDIEDDGEGREDEGEDMARACCVCMVRHKGAAFIPCGHTFCRPCSRELWLTRADCPLCNAFIHDILHIF